MKSPSFCSAAIAAFCLSGSFYAESIQAAPPTASKSQPSQPQLQRGDTPAGVPIPPAAFQAKGLRVLGHQRDPRSGLHIWTVQHVASGTKTILYSTSKNEVFLAGAMWDGTTGGNVSDPLYASPLMTGDERAAVSPTVATATAGKPAAVPGSIKRLGELVGVKDGDAPIEKTLFVFFDPRCPYCHQLYEVTRNTAALNGRAIVWLPVTILGQKERGAAIVADILQRDKPAEGLQIAFSGFANANATPNAKTTAAIQENERIFWAAFQANPGAGQASVPVAFFMDKAGHPQMVANPAASLSKIFQEMN